MTSTLTRLRIGIVGGTGYTGVELLRLLAVHPHAEVVAITSRSEDGIGVADRFPSPRRHYALRHSIRGVKLLAACDVVCFATWHNVGMCMMRQLLAATVRVVGLSSD